MQPKEQSNTYDFSSVPFLIFHAVALIGVLLVPFSWPMVGLCIGMYYLRMFGITAGFHRYFAHRGFKTSRAFQFVLAFLGSMSSQKGVLWWAAHHRDHHKYSDTDLDIHSPVKRGFWYSHAGWILARETEATKFDRIKDFTKYPELVWLNKYWALPPTLMGVVMFLLGGAPALFWGFFMSTVLLWHGTFTINSLSHVFGSRRYQTSDDSRNNWLLALITMGEGWHNNHHHYMTTARNGFFWWELDLSYIALKVLSWFGIVWELRQPPKWVLNNESRGRHANPVSPQEEEQIETKRAA